ncbi:MAG: flagellar motor protein MotB [Myxococcaceae bacterium]
MTEETPRRGSAFPWVLWVLTVLLALAAGYYAWQNVDAEGKGRDSALKKAEEAAAKAKELDQKLSDNAKALSDLESKNKDLLAKADELSGTLSEKQAEIDRLTSTYHALEEKMQKEIKQGDIRLSQDGNRITVDLVDKILFDSGKSELTSKGEEVLGRLGAALNTLEDRQIQVSGHTDDSPISKPELKAQFATNWELSVARAVNVVRYMSEKANVKPNRLVAAGYGQYKPIASNSTPKGRALNRRIEVLLLPPLDAKAAKLPPAKTEAKDGGK